MVTLPGLIILVRERLMNTDCVLPFDFAIDRSGSVMWVDQVDLSSVADRRAEFHASISA